MARSKISPSWLVCALALVLFVFSLITSFGERGLLHLWRLTEERRRLGEKNFRLHQENEILREKIDRLRHDDRYLEKRAREDLGFVAPGEIVYQFASEDSRDRRKNPLKEDDPRPLLSWERRERP